jgi:hypothetical protein
MAIDNNQGYGDIGKKIASSKTFIKIKSDIKSISSQANSSFEEANKDVANSLDKLTEEKNRLQKQVQTQFEQLLKIFTLNRGKGSSTNKYLKTAFTKTLFKIKPEIEEILVNAVISAIGCSQQQQYQGNQTLYIPVPSVDFKFLLKIDPNAKAGKVKYEKQKDLSTGNIKYPMNRQLYQRISEQGILYPFNGASGQNLFDISYEPADGSGQPGDWFKVDLKNRADGVNKISDFLRDYYRRMEVVEITNIFAQLMDQITGAVSFNANLGLKELEEQTKFSRLLQRAMGLCFDNRAEIDVSGNSKIGELDNLDDGFFEFTNLDLLQINQEVTNVQNNAVEFEGCDNIKFPVNSIQILDSLDQLNSIEGEGDELVNAINNLTSTFTNNPELQGIGLNLNVKLALDFSFIKELPKALVTSLLTPKMMLPIFVMIKALNPNGDIEIKSLTDFAKKYKSFFIEITTKIGGLFVKELFRILKKDITILIRSIAADLAKEKALKKYALIINLIAILIQIAKIINDWRQCKNIIDQLLGLFGGIGGIPSFKRTSIPLPLLLAVPALPGYSANRAFINQIEELQKLGLPTGPLPDGSPNLGLIAAFASLQGQAKELNENAINEFAIPPIPVIGGVTSITTFSGKFV